MGSVENSSPVVGPAEPAAMPNSRCGRGESGRAGALGFIQQGKQLVHPLIGGGVEEAGAAADVQVLSVHRRE